MWTQSQIQTHRAGLKFNKTLFTIYPGVNCTQGEMCIVILRWNLYTRECAWCMELDHGSLKQREREVRRMLGKE